MTEHDSLVEYEEQLARYLQSEAGRAGIPGIALQIIARGHVARTAVGFLSSDAKLPMSTRALLSAGHISHLLMALRAAHLHLEGRLDLQDRIGSLIPELDGSEVGDRVRVADLLSHTGGYTSFSLGDAGIRKSYSWTTLIEDLRQSSIWFEPGTVFSFSPTVAPLLVEILRRHGADSPAPGTASVSSSTVQSWLHHTESLEAPIADAHVFRAGSILNSKLDFTRSYCDFWRASGLASLLSVKYVSNLLLEKLFSRPDGNGLGNGVPGALMNLVLKTSVSVPAAAGDPDAPQLPVAVGLGAFQYADGWYGCNGPGFGHWFGVRFSRSHQAAIVLGMNAHSPLVADRIMRNVVGSLTGAAPREASESGLGVWAANEIVGTYTGLAGGRVRITEGQDVLHFDASSTTRRKFEQTVLCRNRKGQWMMRDVVPNLRVAIFRDPSRFEPCLMINDKAYRKTSGSSLVESDAEPARRSGRSAGAYRERVAS